MDDLTNNIAIFGQVSLLELSSMLVGTFGYFNDAESVQFHSSVQLHSDVLKKLLPILD